MAARPSPQARAVKELATNKEMSVIIWFVIHRRLRTRVYARELSIFILTHLLTVSYASEKHVEKGCSESQRRED